MFEGRNVAVVIPAFNVEAHIPKVIGTMPGFVDRIIVVDDASRDRTAAAADRARDPRTIIVRHESNRGVGGAIIAGYRAGLAQGMDLIAVMAGDGQMHPDDLTTLLAPLAQGRADYAKGDRLGWPGAFRVMPLARFVGNHLFTWLTRLTCGYPDIRDSQCGYTAITNACLARLDLDTLYPRYGFPNDLLSRLSDIGASVAQLPVRPIYGDEKSGISLLTVLVRIPRVLLSAWTRRRRCDPRIPASTMPSLRRADRS